MGISYSAYLSVGYIIEEEEFFSLITCVETEGEYRYEDRYDPKTGEKVEPAKFTVREPDYHYTFEGEKLLTTGWGGECEESAQEALMEILQKRTGAKITKHFDTNSVLVAVAEDKLTWEGETTDYGRVIFGSSLTYQSVFEAKWELERIKKAFEELDIDLGEPLVIHDTSAG